MTTLTSLVLHLATDKRVTLPGHLARAVYRFFLDDIAEHDTAFSQALHNNRRRKPFTCSTLIGGRRLGTDSQEFLPETAIWLRLTGLTQAISTHLQRLAAEPPATAVIDRVLFQICEATVDSAAHRWAGQSSYEALASQQLARRPLATLQMEFASPTTFRMTGTHGQKRSWPVPMPRWVFGSLYRQWNQFSPVPLDPALPDFIEEYLVLSQYRLSTRAVPGKGRIPQMGCVGEAAFAVIAEDNWLTSQLHLLTQFAFYSGVGYQTTTGLGQTRPLRPTPDE